MSNDYMIIVTNYEIDLTDCDPFEIEALSENISINYNWDEYELSVSGPEAEVKETVAHILTGQSSFEDKRVFEYAKRHDYSIIEVRNGSENVLIKSDKSW